MHTAPVLSSPLPLCMLFDHPVLRTASYEGSDKERGQDRRQFAYLEEKQTYFTLVKTLLFNGAGDTFSARVRSLNAAVCNQSTSNRTQSAGRPATPQSKRTGCKWTQTMRARGVHPRPSSRTHKRPLWKPWQAAKLAAFTWVLLWSWAASSNNQSLTQTDIKKKRECILPLAISQKSPAALTVQLASTRRTKQLNQLPE